MINIRRVSNKRQSRLHVRSEGGGGGSVRSNMTSCLVGGMFFSECLKVPGCFNAGV